MIVLVGRSRRMAVESLHSELSGLMMTNDSGSSISSSVPRTLGDMGAALVLTNVNASLLVLQAAPNDDVWRGDFFWGGWWFNVSNNFCAMPFFKNVFY
jgi:hypothetical protein